MRDKHYAHEFTKASPDNDDWSTILINQYCVRIEEYNLINISY